MNSIMLSLLEMDMLCYKSALFLLHLILSIGGNYSVDIFFYMEKSYFFRLLKKHLQLPQITKKMLKKPF